MLNGLCAAIALATIGFELEARVAAFAPAGTPPDVVYELAALGENDPGREDLRGLSAA